MTIRASRREAICSLAAAAALPAPATASAATVRPSDAERALTIVSPALLEAQVRTAIPPACFEYIHGGAGDEWTMRRNGERLRELALLPHRLAGFDQADTTSRLFGMTAPAPLYVCPMGAVDR